MLMILDLYVAGRQLRILKRSHSAQREFIRVLKRPRLFNFEDGDICQLRITPVKRVLQACVIVEFNY